MFEFEDLQIRQCRRNPRYAVSDRGGAYRIKRDGTLRRLRPWIDGRGCPCVTLGRGPGRKPVPVKVARLVAEAFLGDPPPGRPLVLHYDDDRRNNCVDNLRWGDHSDNFWDAVRNGRRQFKYSDQDVDRVRELAAAGWNAAAIADFTGVSRRHVYQLLSGQSRPDRLNPDRP